MIGRGVASAGHLPAQPKAVLTVTMTLEELTAQIGAGLTTGALGYGDRLTPATVRRIACEADVIPVVLGGAGEILDQGRQVRLFTRGQQAALRHRDQHCTYPRCTDPADWCDRHHLRHWIDGGATDLDNAALLCPRHHTIVHRDRLAGTVVDGQVVWNRTPGSYDHLLAGRPTPPPPPTDNPPPSTPPPPQPRPPTVGGPSSAA